MKFYDQRLLVRAASPRAALEDATHTSRAALRPGTAGVLKNISRSGLCFCESCEKGPASLRPPQTV